jgi:predicted DNA-binding protein
MSGNTFTIHDRHLQTEIEKLAVNTGKPKETILREIIKTGLQSYQANPSKSAQAALDLIAWAEKEQITSKTKDLSTNHNSYAWEE